MKTTYIQFEKQTIDKQTSKKGLLARILTKIFPSANPDFEDKIAEVQYWLLELDSETGNPKREIGLNKERQAILKMPFKRNYGYWTDSNVTLNEFKKSSDVSEISKDSFEEMWEQFGTRKKIGSKNNIKYLT